MRRAELKIPPRRRSMEYRESLDLEGEGGALRVALWIGWIAPIACGCAVGPDYVRPEAAAPERWHAPEGAGVAAAEPDPGALARWWTRLGDATLTDLVERAFAGNRDLRSARARVREARARRAVVSGALFPSIDGTGEVTRSRSSENAGTGETRTLYAVGLDASWELDVFGGTRRAVEAADARIEASEEDLRDVLVSLVAEAALAYLDLRTFQTRLRIAEANLRAQSDTYDIARWRAEAGLTTYLDVERARYTLEQTRAAIPELRAGVERSANALAVLIGEPPGAVADLAARPAPIPVPGAEVAVGVPADALRRRPDVRRAERALAAENAEIGVATADWYPKFALAGTIGLDSTRAGKLFAGDSWNYGVGPRMTWNLLDAGRIRGNVEARRALRDQSLAAFEAAVLGALEEVENALVAFVQEQDRRRSLRAAAEAARRAADLAGEQYASGLIDFQVVLDAERAQLVLEDQLATSEGQVAAGFVRLYKSLGGGWTHFESAAERSDAEGTPAP